PAASDAHSVIQPALPISRLAEEAAGASLFPPKRNTPTIRISTGAPAKRIQRLPARTSGVTPKLGAATEESETGGVSAAGRFIRGSTISHSFASATGLRTGALGAGRPGGFMTADAAVGASGRVS